MPPTIPRFSHDFDIFHDVAEEVTRAGERDVATAQADACPGFPTRLQISGEKMFIFCFFHLT